MKMTNTRTGGAPLSRRSFLVTAVATGLAMAVPHTSLAGMRFDGKKVRVLTWSDATGQAAVKNILKPFGEMTGAEVIADLTGATSEMVAKIKASAARPQYDMVILSGVGAVELARTGVLEKPDESMISNLEQVLPNYRLGADGFGVGYFLWNDGLVYSTRKFATPPASFRELWNPAYKGRVFLPPSNTIMAMELIILAAQMAGSSAKDPTPGFELLKELRPQLLTMGARAPQIKELFRAGSLDVGGPFSPLILTDAIEDPEFGMGATYDLEEGFFSDLQFMVLPKGHPGDKAAVHALMNYALEPSVQATMAEEVWYGPINEKTVLSDVALNSPYIASPELIKRKAITIDKDHLASVRADWTAKYTEILAG